MDKEVLIKLIASIIALIILIPLCIGFEYIEARIQAKAYKDSGVIIENIGGKKWKIMMRDYY